VSTATNPIHLWPRAISNFDLVVLEGEAEVVTTARKNKRFAQSVLRQQNAGSIPAVTVPFTSKDSTDGHLALRVMATNLDEDTGTFVFHGRAMDVEEYEVVCHLSLLNNERSWMKRVS
jgi:hypothetical protein